MRVKRLDGKWVVVTGAGSGIGRAVAEEASRRGAHLALCDIDANRLEAAANELRKAGGQVLAERVDVSKREDMERFAASLHEIVPACDVLVNNAGIALAAGIFDTTPEDWTRIVGINLMGVIHGCDAFGRAMVANGGPRHIVNIASMEGFAAMEGFGAYSTTKFAVVGYTDSLRQELSAEGIGVSVICPGVVRTALTTDMNARGEYDEGIADTIRGEHDKSSFGPDKVARAVFTSISRNTALRPVAPEAWMTWYSRRLNPGMTTWILQTIAHRILHKKT